MQPHTMDVARRVPVRQGDWTEEDGRVTLTRLRWGPVRRALFGKLAGGGIRRMRLDHVGSAAWRAMDGRTVGAILVELRRQFPDEGRLDERLAHYLEELVRWRFIRFSN